ncbi:phage tail tape measure protein [Chondrinema litorale]|uniref:phage tail tape measure protein n=1 Tax=Chondrinema litorale TaxID=2994555 RepID=UPI0025439D71|nr:phage tail tape measure protein [Chondrinema litorale]UZS00270.1 phage tail tape measure protein [Chondrinema litorale]
MPAQGLINMSVLLGMDITQFERNIQRSTRQLKQFGGLFKEVGSTLTVGVTAPLAALGYTSVKAGGDFQEAMNKVRADSQATAEEISKLTSEARELGRQTSFSATEAAEGIDVLAKNGLSVSDILNGAAGASLNLAEATGGELAGAADIATDVMQNFGKKAEDLSKIVDGITGVTVKSKFGIDDYRLALAQAGGVAGKLGVEIEDFNTAIAATASSFASGSDAGTSFKTFLTRLVPSSKQAADLMKTLGLEFFDSAGNMKNLAEISQELKEGFSGLSDEQRNNAASTIFGNDALRTALSLADQGAEGFNKLAENIGKVSASKQAGIRLEGFNGAIKQFQSVLESVQITIANSGILDFAEKLVRGATSALRAIDTINPAILKFATIAAGIAAAIGPAILALGFLSANVLPALFTGFAVLTGPIGLTVAAIVAAAGLIIANWDSVVSYFTKGGGALTFKALKDVALSAFEEIKKAIGGLVSNIQSIWSAIGPYIINITQNTFGAVVDVISTAFRTVLRVFKIVAQVINGDFLGAFNTLKTGIADIVGAVIRVFAKMADSILLILGDLLKNIPGIGDALKDGLEVARGAINKFADSLHFTSSASNEAASGIKKDTETIKNSVENTSPSIDGLNTSLDNVKGNSNAFDGVSEGLQKLKNISENFSLAQIDQQIADLTNSARESLSKLTGSALFSKKTNDGISRTTDNGDILLSSDPTKGEEEKADTFTEFEGLKDKIEEIKNATKEAEQPIKDMESAFASGFNSAADSAKSFAETLKDSIRGVIKGLIAKGIAGVISNTLASAGLAGPFAVGIAGAAGAAAGALFNSAIPKFAKGGLVFGETLGVLGEGKNISPSNPEVVSPLSDLKKFLGNGTGGQDVNVKGKFTIERDVLIAFLERGYAEQSTF